MSKAIQEFLLSLDRSARTERTSLGLPIPGLWSGHDAHSFHLAPIERHNFEVLLERLLRHGDLEQRVGARGVAQILTGAVRESLRAVDSEPAWRGACARAAVNAARSLCARPTWHVVYMPLHGLDVGVRLRMANVCLLPADKRTPRLLAQLLARSPSVGGGSARSETSKLFEDQLTPAYAGAPLPALTVVRVKAATLEAAVDLACDAIDLRLGPVYVVLRLLCYPLQGLQVSPFPAARSHPAISVRGASGAVARWSAAGPPIPRIDEGFLEFAKRLGVMRLARPLPRLTELETGLLTAARWLGLGYRQSNRIEAFVAYFTAIEAMVADPSRRGAATDRVCERVAHLLGTSVQSCRSIEDELRTLYAVRSEVVHRGWSNILGVDVERLAGLASACFSNVLDLVAGGVRTYRELGDRFRRLRYERANDTSHRFALQELAFSLSEQPPRPPKR